MNWTDERVELLKKLWSDGLSASQIAAELGGVTRNAVIGKVHRLGLSGRAKAVSTPAPRPRKPRPAATVTAHARPMVNGNAALAQPAHIIAEPEPEELPEPVANVVPMTDRCTILDLTEFTCRWPVGDPGKTDFFYCGGRTRMGLPYCAYHARLAYQPVEDRNRRRAATR